MYEINRKVGLNNSKLSGNCNCLTLPKFINFRVARRLFKKPSAPVVITCYHWFSSSVSWIHITPPFSYDIEYYPLTWLLDLLLSGIPTKILHKSLIYSSHTTRFTHLIFLIWSLKILQRQMKKICFPGGYWSVSAQRFSSWAMKLTAHLHIAPKLKMLCPIPTFLHIISFTFTSICASLHFPVPSNFTVPKFFPP